MDTTAQIAEAEAKLAELKAQARKEAAEKRATQREAATTGPGEGLNFVALDGSTSRRAYLRAGDITVQVVLAKNSWERTEQKKARVSVSGEVDVDFTAAYEADRADGGPKPRGERPEVDKMFDRLNRQVIANKRDVVSEAVASLPELATLLDGIKLHFSRTAGCACGCSPAFVASQHIRVSVDGRTRNVTDIFVSREVAK